MKDFIRLTKEQVLEAAMVGVRRRVESIFDGRTDNKHAKDRDPWELDIEGACAELAFCLLAGLPWRGDVNTFHTVADVGEEIEVRSTMLEHGQLIVRHDDPDHRIYTLITGEVPLYTPRGWMRGADVKDRRFWRNDWKAWAVPQFILHSKNTIPGVKS